METRKHPRLKEFDYGSNGAYFVTMCTDNRRNILSRIAVGRDDLIPPRIELSPIGAVVDKYIRGIESAYENVSVDKYVIMPNHIHILICIQNNGGMRSSRPTVPTIIRSFKTMVTREIGYSIFQTSFYDHIIRDEHDYLTRWQYIDENPAKWAQDEYYA